MMIRFWRQVAVDVLPGDPVEGAQLVEVWRFPGGAPLTDWAETHRQWLQTDGLATIEVEIV